MAPRPGPRRRALFARLDERDHRAVEERAADETDGNVSELTRRLLRYALRRMPRGWNK